MKHRSEILAPRRLAHALSQGLCVVALVVAVVVSQSAVHWRSNITDDLLFEYHGWCVSQGAVPYVDIWDNKPPGIWWLNALAFGCFGPGMLAPVVLSAATHLVSLIAFVALASRAFRRSLAWPAAIVAGALLTDQRFECGGNRTETYVIVFEVLAMLCYVCWMRRGTAWMLVLAGLFGGAAPLFKQSGVAAGAAITLHLVVTSVTSGWRSWRPAVALWRVGLLLAGFAALPAIAALALSIQGAAGEAWFAVTVFNRAYFAVDDASWTRLDRAWTTFAPAITILTPVAILAVVGLAGGMASSVVSTPRSARPRRAIGLFLMWWGLAAYLAAVGPGRREHHLMPSLAPLGMILLYGVHWVAARRGLWHALAASPMRATGVVVWSVVVLGVIPGSVAEARKSWAAKPAWWALERRVPAACEAQAAVVAALTNPTERIYVSGWSPGTYRFAYRLPASRFATFEKLGQVGEHARFIVAEAQGALRRQPPKVFVISIWDYEGALSDRSSDWGAWLCGNYRFHSDVHGMRILVWRGGEPSFGLPPAGPLASRARSAR